MNWPICFVAAFLFCNLVTFQYTSYVLPYSFSKEFERLVVNNFIVSLRINFGIVLSHL